MKRMKSAQALEALAKNPNYSMAAERGSQTNPKPAGAFFTTKTSIHPFLILQSIVGPLRANRL